MENFEEIQFDVFNCCELIGEPSFSYFVHKIL